MDGNVGGVAIVHEITKELWSVNRDFPPLASRVSEICRVQFAREPYIFRLS